jgi:anti-anti-sigma factor
LGKAVVAQADKIQDSTNTPLQISVVKQQSAAVVRLSGRLDMSTSPDLRNVALQLYSHSQCKDLTVDFGDVSYLDTAGLATLLEILIMAKGRGANLTLAGLKANVLYLIEVNGLAKFFRIECSLPKKVVA